MANPGDSNNNQKLCPNQESGNSFEDEQKTDQTAQAEAVEDNISIKISEEEINRQADKRGLKGSGEGLKMCVVMNTKVEELKMMYHRLMNKSKKLAID